MSTPTKAEETFDSAQGNDLYPDLSSPVHEGAEGTAHPEQIPPPTEEQLQEWNVELEKVEGEIATLRQVLGAKVRYASELKRKLGITPLQEMKHDFQLGIKSIKDSSTYQRTNEAFHDINDKIHQTTAYQKTSEVAKNAVEKTSTVVAGIGKKLGDLRNSQTFKSVEGKMESAYASVKALEKYAELEPEIDQLHDYIMTQDETV